MRKKAMSFLIAIALVLSCLSLSIQPALAADYIAAEHTASNGRPYYIMVDRTANMVTVYGLDAAGYYTVPAKVMVCSVGRSGSPTPAGNFSVTGYKRTWLHMVDGSYGQYATQFYGNYLFHSVCYSKADPSTLITDEYNMLGEPASLGCVRLQTADAKWIYDNCAAGTRVTIYDGSDPSPLDKPDTMVSEITPEMDNGWDPTDPRENNPWRKPLPFDDVAPGAWYYSDVRYVYESGLFAGTGEGTFLPGKPATYAMAVQALYRMSGADQAGDTDRDGDAWFSAASRWAAANGLLNGMTEGSYDPNGQITRQELVALFYQYETVLCGRPASGYASLSDFSDNQEIHPLARDAVGWAVENRLIQGTSADRLQPTGHASRAQLAALLHRYSSMQMQ